MCMPEWVKGKIVTERGAVRGLRSGRTRGRIVALIAMGALALTALSACRNDSGAAAFVDQTKITSSYVDGVVNSVPAEVLTKLGATKAALQENVAESATFSAVAKQFAKDKGYSTPPTSPSAVTQVAQGYGLPANNAFVKLTVEASTWRAYLLSKQPTRAATEAEYQQVFADASKEGVVPAGTTYEAARSELQQIAPDTGTASALRADLAAAIKKYDVSVNPRYTGTCSRSACTGLEFPIQVVQLPNSGGAFYANFVNMGGTANPAVLDLPTPAAAAAASS